MAADRTTTARARRARNGWLAEIIRPGAAEPGLPRPIAPGVVSAGTARAGRRRNATEWY